MVLHDICSYCRTRKIRCDQAKPHCGQCIEGYYACTYDYGAHTSRKSALAKGSACLNCRRDIMKCDGAKPKCSTCRKSPNDLECIYKPGKKRKKKSDIPQETPGPVAPPPEIRASSFRTSCTSPGRSTGSGSNEIVSIRTVRPAIAVNTTSGTSLSFCDGTAHPNFSPGDPSTNTLVVPSTYCRLASPSQLDFGPEMAYSANQWAFERSFGIFDMSTPVYTIDADPQAFGLSSISVHDRKMLFRMIFVSLRTMHGSYIPFAKLQAIIIGDISGAFIHPFFIHFAEVSGCHFYQHDRSDFSLLQHQGELLQTTYEALDTMRPEDDPLAYAQAHIYMSMAVMNKGNIKEAMSHLRKGANTIRSFNIRFAPRGVGGNHTVVQEIGGYSEEAHERAVFLSKILHFEAYLSLYVMGLPGIQSFNADRDLRKVSHLATQRVQASIKDLCDDLEHQFRSELPVAYPVLCEICPLILRAKTMILMKDVRGHMTLVNQQAFGVDSWLLQTETLIIRLQQHIVIVLKLADKFAETSEHDSTVSLRSHSVITLTGLSELYRLLVRHPLSTPAVAKEAQKRCADILKMIANITEKMLKEDWRQMANFVRENHGDPIMGFPPSGSSLMALTPAGGFAGTPSPVPSRAFLENLENFNDQAKRLAEGDEKLVGTSFEAVPKLFRTRSAEGSQPIRPDLRSGFQDRGSYEG